MQNIFDNNINNMDILEFYKNKKVLITGHTGFKGAWLSEILLLAKADVVGYALSPEDPSLFQINGLDKRMKSYFADIRDYDSLRQVFIQEQPEIVFHMAAQPLVKDGYLEPKMTYETNINGTLNVLECMRSTSSVKSFLNITTDKVYKSSQMPHEESDMLDGFDPYSNSKSCSELITQTYARCYFKDSKCAISTARSGNVIGGGDFNKYRLLSDCMRAVIDDKEMVLHNPDYIRPYYHVLDALKGYMTIAMMQYIDHTFAGSYNLGPTNTNAISNQEIITLFKNKLEKDYNYSFSYIIQNDSSTIEDTQLLLNTNKIQDLLHWHPTLSIEDAIGEVATWTYLYKNQMDTKSHIQDMIHKVFHDE